MEMIPKRIPNEPRVMPAKPITIRQGASLPMNPDEPSILNKMPAELRNEVYRLLFLHEEPLILMDPEKLCEESDLGYFTSFCDALESEVPSRTIENAINAEYPTAVVPAYSILSSTIPLLRTCR
jgi:hypothetical protein